MAIAKAAFRLPASGVRIASAVPLRRERFSKCLPSEFNSDNLCRSLCRNPSMCAPNRSVFPSPLSVRPARFS